MSEALNLADDQRPAQRRAALELLEFLDRETPFPGAPRVGLTGAPGAGACSTMGVFLTKSDEIKQLQICYFP